jgi:membrane protein required for beta-lactamase induction
VVCRLQINEVLILLVAARPTIIGIIHGLVHIGYRFFLSLMFWCKNFSCFS